MESANIKSAINEMFEEWSGERSLSCNQLPESGSYRVYFRIRSKSKTAIAVFNEDKKENEAFLSFSRHFKSQGLNVPEIYAHVPRRNTPDSNPIMSHLKPKK